MRFGAHVRTLGRLTRAADRAVAAGFDGVQIFTQSPRQWRAPASDPQALARFRQRLGADGVAREVICHATYLINVASPDPDVAERSRRCLQANLAFADEVGASALVLHPGSHGGRGLDACLDQAASSLRHALDAASGSCRLLLENTAGAGATIGRDLDELAALVDATAHERVGVCLDSQHLWASGIRFDTPAAMDGLVADLDRRIGLDRLGCLHLNDSEVGFGAQRDRHANLLGGQMGPGPLQMFLGHPKLQHLLALMEIPGIGGDSADAADIAMARRLHAEGVAAFAASAVGLGVSRPRRAGRTPT